MSPAASELCTRTSCAGTRQQLLEVNRILAPYLQPKGIPADALREYARISDRVTRERNALYQAHLRCIAICKQALRGDGLVGTDQLALALYLDPKDFG
ncbi:MAG: hypothetical protein ABWY93_22710 [Mycobacterium sp.]